MNVRQAIADRPDAAAIARPRRAVLSGACASLVGLGLARFAYTPLLPAIIGAGWFPQGTAAYLGAANLAGYLAGALLGLPLASRATPRVVLRGMMVLAAASFVACAWPGSVAWFFAWRFASGIAGGCLMVLAAPLVLPLVPAARRGLASGMIFSGIGVGIALSGTLVPALLDRGLAATWLALGALAFALTVLAWNGWPRGPVAAAGPARAGPPPARASPLRALYVCYALNAVGLVAHIVFLVDFAARGLGWGIDAGARQWVVYGLGAVTVPLLAGAVADRIGFARALRLTFLIETAAMWLLVLDHGALALSVSSAIIGGFTSGLVPLVLGRTRELVSDPARRQPAWSIATICYAVGQAGGAYGLSFVFARTGEYLPLFAISATALTLALGLFLLAGGVSARSAARP